VARSRGSPANLGGSVRDIDANPLFKKGNLAMFQMRDGTFASVLVLNWEASLDWVEVLFNCSGEIQWVRTEALGLVVNEGR
jgi:hypothetical protein